MSGATVSVWVISFQGIQLGSELPSERMIEFAASEQLIAQANSPLAKQRSIKALDERAPVSETGACRVVLAEALMATVAVTGVGAVYAIALQLHVVGLIVTTLLVLDPEFALQPRRVVFTVRVDTI